MILTLIVGDVQIPYYVSNGDSLKTVYAEIPQWYVPYAIVGLASNIAIVVGMWRMKKWAAYLLLVYFATKIMVDAAYVLPNQRVAVFATTIIGAGFWFWAVMRKWKMFDQGDDSFLFMRQMRRQEADPRPAAIKSELGKL